MAINAVTIDALTTRFTQLLPLVLKHGINEPSIDLEDFSNCSLRPSQLMAGFMRHASPPMGHFDFEPVFEVANLAEQLRESGKLNQRVVDNLKKEIERQLDPVKMFSEIVKKEIAKEEERNASSEDLKCIDAVEQIFTPAHELLIVMEQIAEYLQQEKNSFLRGRVFEHMQTEEKSGLRIVMDVEKAYAAEI